MPRRPGHARAPRARSHGWSAPGSSRALRAPLRRSPRLSIASASAPYSFSIRVEQCGLGDPAVEGPVEVSNVHLGADRGVTRQPRVGDALLNGGTPSGAGHEPDRLAVDLDGLGPHRDLLVVEHYRSQGPRRRWPLRERVGTDEVAVVAPDGEAEAGIVGRVAPRHVRAPGAVALLETEGAERGAAGGDHAVRGPGRPEGVPQPRAVGRRARELPPELAGVGDPHRVDLCA